MKRINMPMLFLAFLVVGMFCLAGIAIAYEQLLLMGLCLLLGFVFMGYGLFLKRRSDP